MEIRPQTGGYEHWQAQIMLVPAFENEDLPTAIPDLAKICPWLAKSPPLADFRGKKGEMTICYGPEDENIQRVLVMGLGKKDGFPKGQPRQAIASAIKKCKSLGIESALLPHTFLSRLPGGERLLEDCACAAMLSLYKFDKLKTVKKDTDPDDPKWLAIGFSGDEIPESSQTAITRGVISAQALALARDLDNTPGNMLYPELLALKAAELAGEHGFACSILDENELKKEGFGCLLGVGHGSTRPPRLIVIEHAPKGHDQEKPLILVGKGITFDSGGLCIKPAANMDQMKCDMSGAAAVLAVIDAAAQESIPRRIIGILACAENMPDGGAYRPGDVLTCVNGETVEVVNTDAEGRLVLCDALAYAQKKWTPAAIIDIATLTGACAVALGNGLAGLFCENDDLASRIAAYGAATGEDFWRMPLWQPYAEQLDSNIADIRHTAGREGGAITAALFLAHFIRQGGLWAHLDIAGVDWNSKASAICPEGATAFGVRTLLELARGGIS